MVLHEIKQKQVQRALTIGVWTEKQEKQTAESLLKELSMLADTAHIPVVHSELIRIREKIPSTLLGSGKIEELLILIREHNADTVIFDTSLSPLQQRNLEAAWNVQVFDRSELNVLILKKHSFRLNLPGLNIFFHDFCMLMMIFIGKKVAAMVQKMRGKNSLSLTDAILKNELYT